MRRIKRAKIFFPVLLVVGAYILSFFGGAESVKEAIALCAQSLVPGLFCSIVLSLFLIKSGIWTYLGHNAIAILALICGFPSGAIMASSLYEKGEITEKSAERVSFLYSLPSPAFVVVYVGKTLHGSFFEGVMLYLVLVASLLICDMIFYPKTDAPSPKKACKEPSEAFVDAVSETGSKCLTVCSFVIFFYVLGNAVSGHGAYGAVILSLLELTHAVKEIASLSPDVSFAMSAAALSFSGISVWAQIGFYMKSGGLSMRGYFVKRVTLAAFAILVSLCLLYLPPAVFGAFCGFVLTLKYLQNGRKNKKHAENAPQNTLADMRADKAEYKT